MTAVILQALFHIDESPFCPSGEVAGVFEGFLLALAEKLTSRNESVLGKSKGRSCGIIHSLTFDDLQPLH